MGSPQEKFFTSIKVDKPAIVSAWNKFPTDENPNARYKFLSFTLERHYDVTAFSRQTYGLLDLLGDCGGLLDALKMISQFILLPVVNWTYKWTLASILFKFKARSEVV